MNPFPKYRKIKMKKKKRMAMSEAAKHIDDRIVESNPWHEWWEDSFPGLLFYIYFFGSLLIATIVGLDPLSFFIGSSCTSMVIGIFQDLKKKRSQQGSMHLPIFFALIGWKQ